MPALGAALVFVLAAASSQPAYLRMKKAELIDQHGFEKPIPALSLLVPSTGPSNPT